jgi:hypothetical protein
VGATDGVTDVVLQIDLVSPTPANNTVSQNESYLYVNASMDATPTGCLLYLNTTGTNSTMNIDGNTCYLNTSGFSNQTTIYYYVWANSSTNNWNTSEHRTYHINLTQDVGVSSAGMSRFLDAEAEELIYGKFLGETYFDTIIANHAKITNLNVMQSGSSCYLTSDSYVGWNMWTNPFTNCIEDYDIQFEYTGGSFFPIETGIYDITCHVTWEDINSGYDYQVAIFKSGSQHSTTYDAIGYNDSYMTQEVNNRLQLTGGVDYVYCAVYHTYPTYEYIEANGGTGRYSYMTVNKIA